MNWVKSLTKGPWYLTGIKKRHIAFLPEGCTVLSRVGDAIGFLTTTEEDQANAIAMSKGWLVPETVEALEACLQSLASETRRPGTAELLQRIEVLLTQLKSGDEENHEL